MPHLGVNAVYKAAKAVLGLEAFDFQTKPHAVMGGPTMNVGTFEGGQGVNLVPDEATIGVDIRTVAGMDHAKLLSSMKALLKDADIEVFSNMPAVWTEPEHAWIQRVFEICAAHEPRTATYNTDAGNLLRVYKGAPTVVLGPGEPQMAHQTDEYCSMERIRQSVALYEALIRDWCVSAG
jgi:succinyl-diaminopimelate desuccinylase